MKTIDEEHEERRLGTRQMVKNLLAERQEMLVAFCRLAGLEPYAPDKPVKRLLEEFCQLLMDYTAFSHFELYRRISEGDERRLMVQRVAEQVSQTVTEVTDCSVEFNDKYDPSKNELPMDSLPQDLSDLGERLAVRLELEDQLIEALLQGVPDAADP